MLRPTTAVDPNRSRAGATSAPMRRPVIICLPALRLSPLRC